MRPRTLKLACMLLLLCAFGGADAAARSMGEACRDCAQLKVLLLQVAAVAAHHSPDAQPLGATQQATTSAAPSAQPNEPWAMRPPAAHSAQQHAVTSSGL